MDWKSEYEKAEAERLRLLAHILGMSRGPLAPSEEKPRAKVFKLISGGKSQVAVEPTR